MEAEGVDFLKEYLARHPELRQKMRAHPPSLLWKKGWRPIRAFRLVPSGILVELAAGRRVRLLTQGSAAARRERRLEPLLDLLRRRLPLWKPLGVWAGTDRHRHQSGAFLRVLLRRGGSCKAALIALPASCGPPLSDRLLCCAVLWWHQVRRAGARCLLLFLPESWSEALLRQLPALKIPVACFKYDLERSSCRRIYPRPTASSTLRSPYTLYPYARQIPSLLAEIKRRYPFLDLIYRRGQWELSYLGLKVAWFVADRREHFFNLENPRLLPDAAHGGFQEHLRAVMRLRAFPPPEPQHFYYRYGQERWLESLLLRNSRILSRDFQGLVYPQVPSSIDGERKVLDLLTVTGRGRLAVVELKVTKDLDLIFQGLDYWERVDHHLRRGDFQKAGYFPDLRLSPQSPLLYLVCPLFEFHRVLPLLRRYLHPRVRATCVGINSDWKRKIRVLRRFAF